jgi:glycosyltransferase involved in cell wall biosynthesis
MCDLFVSVIVPVYNDSQRLQICLGALEKQTYPKDKYEVIVVDNQSEDDISSLVGNYSQAKLTFESKTGSYAARNKGLSIAKGVVIALTDSDCIPAENWIEKGITNLLSVPNCGLVAGEIEVFCRDPNRPTAIETYDRIRGFEQEDFLVNKHYGATANVFSFKKIFQDVGLFNEELMSGGDKEWGIRVYAAGYKQIYADDVRVAHPARYSFSDLYKKVSRITLDVRSEGSYRVLGRYYRLLRPSLGEITSGWRDPRLAGARQKFQYIFMLFFVKGIKFIEHTRLLLGGEQQRS